MIDAPAGPPGLAGSAGASRINQALQIRFPDRQPEAAEAILGADTGEVISI